MDKSSVRLLAVRRLSSLPDRRKREVHLPRRQQGLYLDVEVPALRAGGGERMTEILKLQHARDAANKLRLLMPWLGLKEHSGNHFPVRVSIAVDFYGVDLKRLEEERTAIHG